MPGQDLTFCYVCGESKGSLMICNNCCDSFHPHCGNYSRHISRGGYCLKKSCQATKLSRTGKACKLKPIKWIETPQEPEALETSSVKSNSSNSSKLTSDPAESESLCIEPTATAAVVHDASVYPCPKLGRKRSRVSDIPIFDCCHLCRKRVRSFTLVMCFSCDRVFCSFCVEPTELMTGRCRVCKGLCSCKLCYQETFLRDFEAITNKKPKWMEEN